ncbi:MAG TPA: hypothetical protein VGU19_04810 [Microvirga sp.]|nr:hypothetical protein [Microvirga sp.]
MDQNRSSAVTHLLNEADFEAERTTGWSASRSLSPWPRACWYRAGSRLPPDTRRFGRGSG